MFDHVVITASNRKRSERFYDTVLAVLGLPKESTDDFAAWGNYEFFVVEDEEATRGLHIAFGAPSQGLVDRFWQIGTEAGYESDGEPGLRPRYRDDYYGAFLLDPGGNSAEAVVHGGRRQDGWIDHLWLRVADVDASTRFYEAIAPYARLFVRRVDDDRTQLISESGSFSVVSGTPTRHVHVAFRASDNTTVDDFHSTATAAGYADNGPPAERAYHPGYHAAYVLDPDGNNIEVVNHNRG